MSFVQDMLSAKGLLLWGALFVAACIMQDRAVEQTYFEQVFEGELDFGTTGDVTGKVSGIADLVVVDGLAEATLIMDDGIICFRVYCHLEGDLMFSGTVSETVGGFRAFMTHDTWDIIVIIDGLRGQRTVSVTVVVMDGTARALFSVREPVATYFVGEA